jgi:hypothetical protein
MFGTFSDMIKNFLEVFIDDFSVYGKSFNNCLDHLKKVLRRCKEKKLVLNWEKCHFMFQEGLFLGHVVSRRGIEVDKSKVDIIAQLPTLTNVKEIKGLLGHARFYQ